MFLKRLGTLILKLINHQQDNGHGDDDEFQRS